MKTIVTGANGFLGKILVDSMQEAEVIKVGRNPLDDIKTDIRGVIPPLPRADMVIHAAGKAHVIPRTAAEASEFFRVNLDGTKNLLAALSHAGSVPSDFVFISTVAVYGIETGEGISEEHPLKGSTPYALSKIRAEEAVTAWGRQHGVNTTILRLPLVVGRNAPGNLGAMVRHIRRGTYFRIGDGSARRSMVLATDVADILPVLVGRSGIYNLTDRVHPSIAEMDSHLAGHLGKRIKVMPEGLARSLARIGDLVPKSPFNTYRLKKLQESLIFSDDKAVAELGWSPRPVLTGRLIS